MVSSSRRSVSPAESSEARTAARVLAIDYGRRRIGLAVSDALGVLPRPLATLERTNRREDLRRLREIVREHGVRRIVVGHPVHLDGSAGEMAAEAERFAARVQKQLGLPVELVDERLSSWEAEQMRATGEIRARRPRHTGREQASATGRRGSKRPRRRTDRGIDHIAAAVILRDYLERHRWPQRKKG